MAFLQQYVIPNNLAVNQTWNRRINDRDYAKYVNDTARGSNINEYFELRRDDSSQVSGTTKYEMDRWNFKFFSQSSSEFVPFTFSCTIRLSELLANQVTVARAKVKDARAVFVELSNTDPEVDDITATATM